MNAEIHIQDGAGFPDLPLTPGLPDPRELSPEAEKPDARIFISRDGAVIACVALWWTDTPELGGEKVGAIGGFAALEQKTAVLVLGVATKHLEDMGCHEIVGPMNGNTWRRYRFVTRSNGRLPFLLEPRNPENYPEWWSAGGFDVLATYTSSLIPLDEAEGMPHALKMRLLRSGVIVRKLDPGKFEEELRAIHQVSLKSFASNFLYTPLDEASFIGAYQKVKAHVDPDFVRIAERDGVACGFVFAIPDLEAAQRGERPALIVKTLAVDPGSRCAGLGSLLVEEVQEAARAKGFTTALHALQYQDNTSLKITSRNHGEAFRQYTLFHRVR